MALGRILIKFIRIAYQAYRKMFGVVLFRCLVYAAQAFYIAMFVSLIIKCLESRRLKDGVSGIIVWVLAGTGIHLLKRFSDYLYETNQERMKERLDHIIFDKICRIPYEYLENPYYLDLVKRAKFCIKEEGCIDSVFRRGFGFIQNVFVLASISGILIHFDRIVFIILAGAAVLNIIFYMIFVHIEQDFFEKSVEIDRKYVYYLDTLLSKEYGKDYRFYTVGKLLLEKFGQFSGKLTQYFDWYRKKVILIQGIVETVKYIAMIGIYFSVFRKTMKLKLTVSSFSFYATLGITFLNTVSECIENVMRFYMFLKYAEPMIELMELKEEISDGTLELGNIETLEFRNVTFTYPNSSNAVLKDVSFAIHKREKISIVGLNGAGKTTIVKLLCRLYQPNEGEILVNNQPINNYQYSSYIAQISTLFQDFRLFAVSVEENVADVNANGQDILEILRKVNLKDKVEALPQGAKSIYSKVYDEDGVEFSGGEEQKLALARMLNKRSSLKILDEPTSAMDPYAEAEFYQTFDALAGESMVIYISHRMSSSVLADRILVIENGTVADFDTHEKLLAKKGRYQELFNIQAEHYS